MAASLAKKKGSEMCTEKIIRYYALTSTGSILAAYSFLFQRRHVCPCMYSFRLNIEPRGGHAFQCVLNNILSRIRITLANMGLQFYDTIINFWPTWQYITTKSYYLNIFTIDIFPHQPTGQRNNRSRQLGRANPTHNIRFPLNRIRSLVYFQQCGDNEQLGWLLFCRTM